MGLEAYLKRQRAWSRKTFGPGRKVESICRHVEKELVEVREEGALEEWVDVVILALDGALRTGASPREVCAALEAKFQKNLRRRWPDWREVPKDQPIEHLKDES